MNSLIRNLCAGLAASAALMASGSLGLAADYIEPVPEVVVAPPAVGGWYLRGDVGYSAAKFRGASYTLPGGGGCNTCGEGDPQIHGGKLKGSFLLGGGVGYQVTDYFRTDLTLDYMTRAKFTSDRDESQMSALSLLANAYVDLGNFGGVTPYVGAGIGGTRVKWDDLVDTTNGGVLSGDANWRFTYALMAGASVDLTQNLKLDAGYRYRHINGGKMFNGAYGVGDGYDKGMNVHDVRVGLRYMFGG
ncbi:porin family protein [Brucella pituitosa]|uniref:Porin family protein n=1 Tax=Brucella pituitosa TaxID=571256 RepID=A0A643EW40_9HYPH|nr:MULTISPECIES: outer membrane protein [Brucella]PQZ47448.1 porin family protein [Ochrobactrum sp. MYb19]PRA53416.1 porin family protein [Ochrobactrum sp. MYb68]PRA62136.1 porin family protein [Ochrobactrum sp. MYb18]PRA77459.1 porin family protein [Brucella thiophenivorans]PRA85279.1 porin family protein [Ochrobactrum sp. MYb29]PRA87500.1 porin family protein [Ochrobactrum sp. MYb14]PRA99469.1 porin family protein [Ochrobactrum sp. MYb15]